MLLRSTVRRVSPENASALPNQKQKAAHEKLTEEDKSKPSESAESGSERTRLSGHFEVDLPESEDKAGDRGKKKKRFGNPLANDLQKPRFYLEIVALVVVSFYTAFAGYQSCKMREANRLSHQLLETTRDNFRNEERPYVWVAEKGGPVFEQPNANFPNMGQIIWTWHYQNYGKTPALHVSFQQYFRLGKNGVFEPAYGQKGASPGPPQPPTKDNYNSIVSRPITIDLFKQLMQQDNGISIKADIVYYGTDGRRYESIICLGRLRTSATDACPEQGLNEIK